MDPISAGISLISSIVARVWPDASQAEKDALTMQLQQNSDLVKLLTAQITVDQNEAANPSLFVSGWRPALGWICASAFAYQYIILPIITLVVVLTGHTIPLPTFDFSTMSTVLMGILGLGGMRSFEKTQGVARVK